MKPISLADVSTDLAGIIDRAADDHEPVLITRDGGKPAAVLMSLEDFASYEETAYLLRSPANARELRESIAELEAGRGVERKLIESGSFSASARGNNICSGSRVIAEISKS